MNPFRPVLPALLALSLVACSGPDVTTLTITALSPRVEVGPENFSVIEVRGRIGEKTILYEGSELTVMTDCGSFAPESNEQSQSITIQGQKATARLYSPRTPCTANVTARYVDFYGVEVRATTTVQFTVPPVAKLNFSCTAKNIGAFLDDQDMAVRCDATPEDAAGVAIRNAQVKFITEAGKFTPYDGEQGAGARVLFTYNPKEDGREPKDVEPIGDDTTGEPRWTDPNFGNRVRNPRDGLVTLVAYVESPNDGLQGEPYVDADDNDQYDPGEDYVDLNGNGRWDDQQDTHLWKMIKILWTGEDWGTPAGKVWTADGGFDIERGQQRTINFRFLDRNLNVLSTGGVRGVLEWSAPEGTLTFVGGETREFGNVDPWGIDIDNNTYKIRNRGSSSSYMRGSTYSVTVRNDIEPGEPSEPYQIFASVSRATATDEEGAPTNEIDEGMDVFATGILK